MSQQQQQNQEVQKKKMKLKKCISICLSGGSIPQGKHITLQFKPSKDTLPQILKRLGQPVAYKQGPILQGLGVVCVVCSFDEKELYTGESMPHVTTECLDGTPPATSNVLINAYVQENGAFKPQDFDAGFVGYISAMYYSSGGKSYSISAEDWDI